jgi:CheY-like chemotaxis protein
MPHDIASGIKAGFFRYITKPIKIDDFMEVLDMTLEYVQQHRPPS